MQVITIVTAMKKQQWKWRGDHFSATSLKTFKKIPILILRGKGWQLWEACISCFLLNMFSRWSSNLKIRRKGKKNCTDYLLCIGHLLDSTRTEPLARAFPRYVIFICEECSTFALEAFTVGVTLDPVFSIPFRVTGKGKYLYKWPNAALMVEVVSYGCVLTPNSLSYVR